jgi:hypothetical protein
LTDVFLKSRTIELSSTDAMRSNVKRSALSWRFPLSARGSIQPLACHSVPRAPP